MSDDATSKFMSSAIDMVFLAEGAAESNAFEAEEASRLRDDAAKFRQSAAKIFYGIESLLSCAILRKEANSIDFTILDDALNQLIISSYRIGAATWTHNANGRYLKSREMCELRKAKAKNPKQLKRERIKNTVLPPLLARRAPRHEQLAALNNALASEGLDQISQETSDRWSKQVVQATALAGKNL